MVSPEFMAAKRNRNVEQVAGARGKKG